MLKFILPIVLLSLSISATATDSFPQERISYTCTAPNLELEVKSSSSILKKDATNHYFVTSRILHQGFRNNKVYIEAYEVSNLLETRLNTYSRIEISMILPYLEGNARLNLYKYLAKEEELVETIPVSCSMNFI